MKNKGLRVKRRKVPPIVNGTTPPRRVANAALRPREYLTAEEVDLLMKVAAQGKECGHRDATMITLAYRHGLRVGELVAVRWDQLDFRQGTFHVRRLKQGRPSVHVLRGTELRMLRRLQREQSPRYRQLIGRRSRRVGCCRPYAAAVTPVISAQSSNALVRMARYSVAVT